MNGNAHNRATGKLLACREHIAVVQQRGYLSEEARWLLERIDPEQNAAALISFVTSLADWASTLENDEREKWIVWALKNQPDKAKKWMGYRPEWTMLPAPVAREYKKAHRVYNDNGMPKLYLVPGEPRDTSQKHIVTLENGDTGIGVKLATVTYLWFEQGWFKAYLPKRPSESAITRALRLFVTGVLVGRDVFTSNDLMVYEMIAIRDWALYGDGRIVGERLCPEASYALRSLVAKPEMAAQIPS